jgi:site-specific recombinase XerD
MVDPFRVRVVGPLSSQAHGFAAELIRLGYSPRTTRDHVYVLAQVSRWLADEGLTAARLTPEAVDRFLLARAVAGCRRWRTLRSLQPMLDYLRGVQAVPSVEQAGPESPLEALLAAYLRYLVAERRLAAATVRVRVEVAHRLLSALLARGDFALDRLAPVDVTGFVLSESRRYQPGSMKALTVALRCLLRFLFVTGVVNRDLSAAVPAVANPRMSGLPNGVDAATVAALLAGCDRSTAVGLRDFAILTMLIRLGLRAGEVAALRLDDVHWRAGELTVRGKGNRIDRLPLPHDVGAALVDYLRHGRRRSACRALFLRACAPDGAMTARSVGARPRTASMRAGLSMVGAHRLRHTAATGMLQAGASLPEIAQALRHHTEATTAIYARVDRKALAAVVRPWPGTGR